MSAHGDQPHNQNQGRSTRGWLDLYGMPTWGLPAADLPVAEDGLAGIERRESLAGEFDLIRRIVRAAAAASCSEAEFARRLRTPKVMLQPRLSAVDNSVVGYGLRDPRTAHMGPEVSDRELGSDCLLAELRLEWDTSDQARLEASAEWRQVGILGRWQRESVVLTSAVMWRRAVADASAFHDWLQGLDDWDHHSWQWAAGRVAGVLAIWSLRTEPGSGGPLAAASEQLAHSAWMAGARRRPQHGEVPAPGLARTAYVLAQQSSRARDVECEALLAGKLTASVMSIAKSYRRRGWLGGAIRLTEKALTPLHDVERQLHEQLDSLPREDDGSVG
ncbi:hypothetical protein IU459_33745 [Nocardia amamiensis]|uniref:Uncharacterized protein n=1 Tax=Nocardia amamiensis TaxID=404578 RepID=A0ABS0D0U6_9NOCA|nr:hypothetical protein [Nocardia amamiensis]MBF6302468.1 hypothetical protein [Nocardia amamiensis]